MAGANGAGPIGWRLTAGAGRFAQRMRQGDTSGGDRALIERLAASAIDAGEAIMRFYAGGCAAQAKADGSPVTAADAAAEAIILADLAGVAPGIPVIAEEEVAAGRIPDVEGEFFLVDPLDGTREFVGRREDFTVNIALIRDHVPVFGIVYAPAHRRLYAGVVADGVAWRAPVSPDGAIGPRQPLHVRDAPADGIAVVASRSHRTPETDAYLAHFAVADILSCGSSLKICMVAEGLADLYPRLGPTCEWDIAAGDAVLRAAGGRLLDARGGAMRYGKPRFFNPAFVATGTLAPPPVAAFLPG